MTQPPVTDPVLGLETSCDETAAAIVAGGAILADVVSSQIPLHARFGGVIPELASRNHLLAIAPVVRQALAQAGLAMSQVKRIAVTRGPGLVGALLVGTQFAKTLACRHDLELVAVHHVEGHITAILLDEGGDHPHGPLAFPYVALAVSGGHTSLYQVHAPGRYSLLGVTRDDAAGEAFDKVARLLGLPYPGGIAIDRLAIQGNPAAFELPRPLKERDNLDFSFSGLKTAVARLLDETRAEERQINQADLAAAFQEAVVDVLLRKLFAAARLYRVADVVIAGGVAANSRLRARLVAEAPAAGLRAHLTRVRLCTDNAVMIAAAGCFLEPLPPAAIRRLEPFASGQIGAPLAATLRP